jgi:aryl-alcohol dehydrogenase-like predicted oxidoreductase
VKALAERRGCTASQMALAWVLAQGSDIVPIPGTKRRKYLEDNVAAGNLALTRAEVERLTQAFPPNVTAGTRYPEKQLKALGI